MLDDFAGVEDVDEGRETDPEAEGEGEDLFGEEMMECAYLPQRVMKRC